MGRVRRSMNTDKISALIHFNLLEVCKVDVKILERVR